MAPLPSHPQIVPNVIPRANFAVVSNAPESDDEYEIKTEKLVKPEFPVTIPFKLFSNGGKKRSASLKTKQENNPWFLENEPDKVFMASQPCRKKK